MQHPHFLLGLLAKFDLSDSEAYRATEQTTRRVRELKTATLYPLGNKVCSQLYGREAELVAFWLIRTRLLERFGPVVSDSAVAAMFEYLLGGKCSPKQARRRREVIERLEAMPDVWGELEGSKLEERLLRVSCAAESRAAMARIAKFAPHVRGSFGASTPGVFGSI